MLDWLRRVGLKPGLIGLFIGCVLPVGVAMIVLVPPGQVPDEPAHMARAIGLLHGAILPERHTTPDKVEGKPFPVVGVKVDKGLMTVGFSHVTTIDGRPVFTLQDRVTVLSEPSDHRMIFGYIPNTATYLPTAYIPAALGLGVGRLCRASPYQSLVMGRAGMLLAYLLLGAASLYVAAYGEALLLVVLLLPMSLSLAGSLNQDGVLIGMTCLAAACLTRGGKFGWLAAALLSLFLCAKPPYGLMLGFLLLPLRKPGFASRVAQAVVAAAPVLIWVGIVAAWLIVPFGRPPYHPGPLWTGPDMLTDRTNSAVNLHILLARPSLLVSLPWQFITTGGVFFLKEMIGVLGLLSIAFSNVYYNVWGAALAVALAGSIAATRPRWGSWAEALATPIFVISIIAASCWALMISLYINWTIMGADFIDGIQGRYMIPFLPFLLLLWPLKPGSRTITALAAMPAVALAVYDIGFLPMKLVTFFYLY
jgi:hypothetical protein